ncbi:hypothetical protein LRR81_14885 [Metabacillus sp. GX 13764]|uniref:hypothetical protein n=1 Tax=Metabacillus kandeliae TaxID=2900151 RepID=UPI001E3C7982|nr:hypothetical protein [Metabacillus kandeliae]MCD7035529.1 hypothetical protein [Metabacillus kandeliae]
MVDGLGILRELAEPAIELIFGLRRKKKVNAALVEEHLKELRGHQWFRELYENPVYHDHFISNSKVMKYLEDRMNVEDLIFIKRKREKFKELLEKETDRRKSA